jgi:formylglycine-generating enzyme required for sulfatase activity
MTVWHLIDGSLAPKAPSKEPGITEKKTSNSTVSKFSEGQPPTRVEPIKTILGQDGLTMRLIPGGTLKTGQNTPAIPINPFYMDETKVTAYHFVEFLNLVKDSLTVEGGLVKRDGEIWFFLGDGTEPREQITYQHDRFHLRDPNKAAQPVVRVTWYAAVAYAKHFGKRLPTEHEWEFAAQEKDGPKQGDPDNKVAESGSGRGEIAPPTDSMSQMMPRMMDVETPTQEILPNPFGLKEMGENLQEWVVGVMGGQKPEQRVKNPYSSLVIGKSSQNTASSLSGMMKSSRYPWEGFYDVGFRCVAGIP